MRNSTGIRFVLLAVIVAAGCRAGSERGARPAVSGLLTRPEVSGYRLTSTTEDVQAFLDRAVRLSPHLAKASAGASAEGRDLPLVFAADPAVESLAAAARDPRPKILVVGNIHGGEVEGKEAIQVILREIGEGRHAGLLTRVVVLFLPVYNPDGNDALAPGQRPGQDGPASCGRRSNGQRLDLNRDFVKLEAPETRALLGVIRAVDPVLLIDLHTTDGSYHGFDLTYAGPLSPATDPGLLAYERQVFLPALRGRLAAQGVRTFDYGNWPPGQAGSGWYTYDHRPRYGTNYFGLRNRLSLLSEAYSHAPFEERIAASRALVLSALALIAEDREAVLALVRGADRRARDLAGRADLPASARLAATGIWPIPVGGVRRVEDAATGETFLQDTGIETWLPVPTWVAFAGTQPVCVPQGWALADPPAFLAPLLEAHGIAHESLEVPRPARVEVFIIDAERRGRRAFEGHHLVSLEGHTVVRDTMLPAGALVVPASQPLARLAFLILEPLSSDGLGTWDLLGSGPDRRDPRYPVLRLLPDDAPDRKETGTAVAR